MEPHSSNSAGARGMQQEVPNLLLVYPSVVKAASALEFVARRAHLLCGTLETLQESDRGAAAQTSSRVRCPSSEAVSQQGTPLGTKSGESLAGYGSRENEQLEARSRGSAEGSVGPFSYRLRRDATWKSLDVQPCHLAATRNPSAAPLDLLAQVQCLRLARRLLERACSALEDGSWLELVKAHALYVRSKAALGNPVEDTKTATLRSESLIHELRVRLHEQCALLREEIVERARMTACSMCFDSSSIEYPMSEWRKRFAALLWLQIDLGMDLGEMLHTLFQSHSRIVCERMRSRGPEVTLTLVRQAFCAVISFLGAFASLEEQSANHEAVTLSIWSAQPLDLVDGYGDHPERSPDCEPLRLRPTIVSTPAPKQESLLDAYTKQIWQMLDTVVEKLADHGANKATAASLTGLLQELDSACRLGRSRTAKGPAAPGFFAALQAEILTMLMRPLEKLVPAVLSQHAEDLVDGYTQILHRLIGECVRDGRALLHEEQVSTALCIPKLADFSSVARKMRPSRCRSVFSASIPETLHISLERISPKSGPLLDCQLVQAAYSCEPNQSVAYTVGMPEAESPLWYATCTWNEIESCTQRIMKEFSLICRAFPNMKKHFLRQLKERIRGFTTDIASGRICSVTSLVQLFERGLRWVPLLLAYAFCHIVDSLRLFYDQEDLGALDKEITEWLFQAARAMLEVWLRGVAEVATALRDRPATLEQQFSDIPKGVSGTEANDAADEPIASFWKGYALYALRFAAPSASWRTVLNELQEREAFRSHYSWTSSCLAPGSAQHTGADAPSDHCSNREAQPQQRQRTRIDIASPVHSRMLVGAQVSHPNPVHSQDSTLKTA